MRPEVLVGFSPWGSHVAVGLVAAVFVVAFLLGFLLNGWLVAAFAVAAPFAAIGAYDLINPEPSCENPLGCSGRASWIAALGVVVVAWWVGLGLAALARSTEDPET